MSASASADPVEAVTEADADAAIATIFADIRDTLDVGVVNLIWRHLATMPGALEWVWSALKPLYLGPAPAAANDVRRGVVMPAITRFSPDTLAAAGLDAEAQAGIRNILDSYYHTNALALVALSAFLSSVEDGQREPARASTDADAGTARTPHRIALPRLTPISEMPPPVARLVDELNSFGEDSDTALVASMYRHLSHWPSYLALTRTLLAPLDRSGDLHRLVAGTRRLGEDHGRRLAPLLSLSAPPDAANQAIAAVRRFVSHPIARMTAVCALMRNATPGTSAEFS